MENFFDGPFEELSDFESERETGIVFLRFDGVDRLTRNFQPLRQRGLRPVFFGAKFAETVFHREHGERVQRAGSEELGRFFMNTSLTSFLYISQANLTSDFVVNQRSPFGLDGFGRVRIVDRVSACPELSLGVLRASA